MKASKLVGMSVGKKGLSLVVTLADKSVYKKVYMMVDKLAMPLADEMEV